MNIVQLTSDLAMEQFLKSASTTATVDLGEGRDHVSNRFSNQVAAMSAAFSGTYLNLIRALEERRVLVSEREEAVRQLSSVYRALRANLRRQGSLDLISQSVLGRFGLQTVKPAFPTKMDQWLTVGEKMQAVFAELTAEGVTLVTSPPLESLEPLVQAARDKTTALNAKRGEIKDIRDLMKSQRAEAARLHGALMMHIRGNLRGQEPGTIRDVLRRYGYVFVGNQGAGDGETGSGNTSSNTNNSSEDTTGNNSDTTGGNTGSTTDNTGNTNGGTGDTTGNSGSGNTGGSAGSNTTDAGRTETTDVTASV
ncbi:MAG: hypothetical protein QNK37_22915 [Acidobacteriota bacterium]|nr:hypothetical protein [Acidobacteriota bacterium]